MNCYRPITIKNPFWEVSDHLPPEGFPNTKYIRVPCKKCLACRNTMRAQWDFRLFYESTITPTSLFMTFTFDDKHYRKAFKHEKIYPPVDGPNGPTNIRLKYPLEVDYSLFQRFIHDFRRATKLNFKYYLISEMGEHTHRLHYHVLFFFQEKEINKLPLKYYDFGKHWKYGFVHVGEVTPASIHYVTKFHTEPKDQGDGLKMVTKMSQGIGSLALDALKNSPVTAIKYNGYKYPIPSYYRRKLKELYDITFPVTMSKFQFDGMEHDFTFVKDITEKLDSLMKNNSKL